MAKAAAKTNGNGNATPKRARKPATDHGPAPFREYSTVRFEGTLDHMVMRLPGGVRQAVIMAQYGPLRDSRTKLLFDDFNASTRPAEFKLEKGCEDRGLTPSEFVGMVTAGMSRFRLDYEAWIIALRMPELLEKSFDLAMTGDWSNLHELMMANGLHLAPAKANIIIDNRDQSQTANISGMPTFEETLGPMEAIGQRRLPESTATEVEFSEVKEKEYANAAEST